MISNAQNIVSGEYFFDTYKNLGQGTSFYIVPNNVVNKTLSISTNNLSSGMHNLFVRVKDANDTWSLVENKLFLHHAVIIQLWQSYSMRMVY